MSPSEVPPVAVSFAATPMLSPAVAGEISLVLAELARRHRPIAFLSDRWEPAGDRERYLDVAAGLLEEAVRLRSAGHLVEGFALEGIEAQLIEALVAPPD